MIAGDVWSAYEEQLQRESEMENKDTDRLWAAVCETDPSFTKKFTRGGGFSGTATNATYLAKRATEAFGPCGIYWGVHVDNEEILQGAPILHGDVVIGHELIHKLRITLWYWFDGKRGEVQHFGQTTFVGRNKNGTFTDEEAPKKSLTDAMSKALSLIGFAADVHLGLYDDNKYVNDLKKKFEPKPEEKPEPKAEEKEALEACNTIADLQAVFMALPKERRAACNEIKDAVKTRLSAQQNGSKPGATDLRQATSPQPSA